MQCNATQCIACISCICVRSVSRVCAHASTYACVHARRYVCNSCMFCMRCNACMHARMYVTRVEPQLCCGRLASGLVDVSGRTSWGFHARGGVPRPARGIHLMHVYLGRQPRLERARHSPHVIQHGCWGRSPGSCGVQSKQGGVLLLQPRVFRAWGFSPRVRTWFQHYFRPVFQ